LQGPEPAPVKGFEFLARQHLASVPGFAGGRTMSSAAGSQQRAAMRGWCSAVSAALRVAARLAGTGGTTNAGTCLMPG